MPHLVLTLVQFPPGRQILLLARLAFFAALVGWFDGPSLHAQVRVMPQPPPPRPSGMPGYKPIAEPWANVPPTFRHVFEFPQWPVSTDLDRWLEANPQDRWQIDPSAGT